MKTKFKLIVAMSFIVFAATSCSEDEPTVNNPNPPVVQDHAYKGNWEGNFTGGDNGTWTMEVDKDGDFTGSAYSNNAQTYYDINGSIDSVGVLTAVIIVSGTELDFIGQGINGDSASGTWGNPTAGIEGDWTGAKK